MKIIVMLVALFTAPMLFAAVETKDFRVKGDVVRTGDSVGALLSKAGTPLHQHSYQVQSGETTIQVTDFVYKSGNEVYTITVKEGKVTKIVWDRG